MKGNFWSLVPLLFLFSLTGLVSCDKEDYNSYAPTFKGFRITPSDPTVGDSITITAVQAEKGHLIYRATYTWEVKCQGIVMYNGTKKVVYDNEPADPQIGFRLPDDAPVGTYTVSFTANYKYSGQGSVINNGGTYEDPEDGISGQISLVNSGLPEGNCSGSITFVVSSKKSYVPTFKGFRVNPSDPTVGDSVTITAVQAQMGHCIYQATYNWLLICQGIVVYDFSHKVVYDNESADPQIGFRLPDDAPVGTYTVSFAANYKFSGQGSVINNGGTYEDPEDDISGQINLVNLGLTEGNCSGSNSFVVSSKQ